MPDSELIAKAEAYLIQCGSCDAGLPMNCVCPTSNPRGVIAALLDALKEEYPRGRRHAAKDIEQMPIELGDVGWGELERRATNAGYPLAWTRGRRSRGDFTTTTIEAAYQYGYRQAAKVALGTTAPSLSSGDAQ
jgi:hypothetical protein